MAGDVAKRAKADVLLDLPRVLLFLQESLAADDSTCVNLCVLYSSCDPAWEQRRADFYSLEYQRTYERVLSKELGKRGMVVSSLSVPGDHVRWYVTERAPVLVGAGCHIL